MLHRLPSFSFNFLILSLCHRLHLDVSVVTVTLTFNPLPFPPFLYDIAIATPSASHAGYYFYDSSQTPHCYGRDFISL